MYMIDWNYVGNKYIFTLNGLSSPQVAQIPPLQQVRRGHTCPCSRARRISKVLQNLVNFSTHDYKQTGRARLPREIASNVCLGTDVAAAK